MAPMTDIESGHLLRHVTDRQAVLFGLGLVTLDGFTDCPSCEQWAPACRRGADRGGGERVPSLPSALSCDRG